MADWTNEDTKAIAEFIDNEDREWIESRKRGTPFWRGTAEEIVYDCQRFEAPPDAPVERLTAMLRYLFCGESDVPINIEGAAGINPSRVDWRQIAAWLVEKSRKSGSAAEGKGATK
jgi:hypothetical protein